MSRSISPPLLALALLLLAPEARAEGPSDAEVTRRLAFISSSLEAGTVAADRWWYGWYIGWTTLTVGEVVFALAAPDRGFRVDSAVGAVSCSLGVIPLGFLPFVPRTAAASLRTVPGSTSEERRRKLLVAESLLRKSSETEALGRSWLTHALGISVSIGAGLVLGLGYKRPVTGIINSLTGIALTEAQIFTQPTAAIGAWRAYESGKFEAPKAATNLPRWTIVPQPTGIGVAALF
ncbi:MAG: hypothetical protein ABJE95_31930 [Byssovorax sp.]